MKSKDEIQRRLKKLRFRYAKKCIEHSQRRVYLNCRHNYAQKPLRRTRDTVEIELAPRQVSTIVLIQNDQEVSYCMYGAENPATWPGIICDRDDIAKTCKWFIPKMSTNEAQDQFDERMMDDDYVYETYPDVAALQWVINDRVHKHKISWFYKLILSISLIFAKFIDKFRRLRMKSEPSVCQLPESDPPKELWTNDNIKNSGT